MDMKKDIQLKIGLILIGIVLAIALVGMFYTPFRVDDMDIVHRFAPPGFPHLFGTDNFGRDTFSRLMVGARFTLFVAVITVSVSAVSGIILGLLTGYLGGVLDECIMRIIDALNSFPSILLALVMVTVLNQAKYAVVVALAILFIPSFTRIVRSGALQYRNREFINSARVFGASPLRIMFVHLLPNIYPSLLSAVVIGLSNAVLAESSLSYLGLGIQPPTPSWGRMLSEAQAYLFNAPWLSVAPGLMIILTVLGYHSIGEGLRLRQNV